MSFFRGQLPESTISMCAIRFRAPTGWYLALLFAGLVVVQGAKAQQDIPLTLAAAEDVALDNEPGQAALLAHANALEEESVAVGQLPDPMLRMGLANFPLQSGGFTTEGMTQAQLGIRQTFPPGKTRAFSTRRFESLSLEMRENADGRGRDVLTAVRHAWLETYYWERAHAIVDESRPFFNDLVTVTRSLYSVGRRDLQDLLRAELELSRLDDRLIDINKQHALAIAALSEWVGTDANRPIAQKLPEWQQVPAVEIMQSNLLAHPALKAAEARVDARQAGIELAEQRYKPGWALDLGYGYRDGFLSNGDPRSDFISLSVTMDLPFFHKNRQDRRLAAALSERRAANESKEQLRRRLSSRLDAEYARWHELTRRIELYEQQILSQARDHARASLVAYQSDTADFADVMRGYIDDLNTRVDYIRLQVEQAQSYAAIANLGGIPR